MNEKLAKKMRRYTKKFSEKAWREFYDVIYQQPFSVRWRIAWAILRKSR